MTFQSTPSAREGDTAFPTPFLIAGSFNPRLPRGKATIVPRLAGTTSEVSIHAFREGRRRDTTAHQHVLAMFQSTPSAREGDVYAALLFPPSSRFNPRLPRGKATCTGSLSRTGTDVSIHAFREGRRLVRARGTIVTGQFQSTPSAREGDYIPRILDDVTNVSIHAFREGRRPAGTSDSSGLYRCFNPRLPRGKATEEEETEAIEALFQSTPSAREGDTAQCFSSAIFTVSIHAFREGRRRLPKNPVHNR